ncbi:MAG: sigma factor-like helix-turn-helix DNA-binding protein [Acidimicrobiales bacterium]
MAGTAQPVSVVDPARIPPWSKSANTSPALFKGPSPETHKGALAKSRNDTSDNPFDVMSKDVKGFDDFFAHVLPRTLRAARSLTGDPWTAEEVAVEALARAHAHWARIAPLPWRDAWVLNVACKRALRRIRRLPPAPAPGQGGNESGGVMPHRELVACLHQLPRREQQTIVLRYICELPEPDVALALGVSARTVKARLRSAVVSFRANIDVDIEEVNVHELHA